MTRTPDPQDYRKAPFELLQRLMAVPGRQNGDSALLVDLERKTRGPNEPR